MGKKKKEGIIRIWRLRAYCSLCGKLLMESNPMTKRELYAVYDKALIDAGGIICRDCGTKIPNFNLNIKIYNSGSKLEFDPQKFFPANPQMQQELDDLISIMTAARQSSEKKLEEAKKEVESGQISVAHPIEDAEIVE